MDRYRPLHVVSSQSTTNTQPKDVRVRLQPQRDLEVADAIVKAVRGVNLAMEDAVEAGLIVEPSLAKATNRFGDLGVVEESHILNVRVFRKLC